MRRRFSSKTAEPCRLSIGNGTSGWRTACASACMRPSNTGLARAPPTCITTCPWPVACRSFANCRSSFRSKLPAAERSRVPAAPGSSSPRSSMRVPSPARTSGASFSAPPASVTPTGPCASRTTPPRVVRKWSSAARPSSASGDARGPRNVISPASDTWAPSGQPCRMSAPLRSVALRIPCRSTGFPPPSPIVPDAVNPRPGIFKSIMAESCDSSTRASSSPNGMPRATTPSTRTAIEPSGAGRVPPTHPSIEAVPLRGTPPAAFDQAARSSPLPERLSRGGVPPSCGSQLPSRYGIRPSTASRPEPCASVTERISSTSGVKIRSPCSASNSTPATTIGETSTCACPVSASGRPPNAMCPLNGPRTGAAIPTTLRIGASGKRATSALMPTAPSPRKSMRPSRWTAASGSRRSTASSIVRTSARYTTRPCRDPIGVPSYVRSEPRRVPVNSSPPRP